MKTTLVRRGCLAGVLTVLLAAGACGGDRGRAGVLVISSAGDADVLFAPTAKEETAKEVLDLLFERLAEIPPDLNTIGDVGWTPGLADRWEWSPDSMAVTFHLNPGARWHDGVPLRASDILFTYTLLTKGGVGGSDAAAMSSVTDSVTVRDSLTCTVWYKLRSPERFYSIVYNLYPLPEHLLGKIPVDSISTSPYTRNPVGNGPFRLVRWDRGQRIEIAAVDSFHKGRSHIDRVIWTFVQEGKVASERVFSGEADMIAGLTPEEVASMSSRTTLRTLPVGTTQYSYLIFNQRDSTNKPHALLSDRGLRRALTMALDRDAIAKSVTGGLGRVSLGPVARVQWSADTTLQQLQFDRAGAAKLLDSLGWRAGPDGMRARNGKPLTFSLLVSSSSQPRIKLAGILQEQWRQVGVDLKVERLDQIALGKRVGTRDFDAVTRGVAPAPSPVGLRQLWSTAAITMPNGFNVGHYSNPKIDVLIDAAVNATSLAAGKANYRAAYQALLDDAPAIWLYEPVVIAAVNKRVTVAPLRSDGWWISIPSWRVDKP